MGLSSTLRREESRSPAQVCSSCPSGKVRSRSRRPSGALVTSACRAEMARVRKVIACARVASSTRMASRSPRRRGSLRPTAASACRAARTASISSLLTPPRRAGRCGRSTQRPPRQASSAVVSPAPKLPVPSMAHNAASWRRPKADQLPVASRIGRNRQMFQDSARRADRRGQCWSARCSSGPPVGRRAGAPRPEPVIGSPHRMARSRRIRS